MYKFILLLLLVLLISCVQVKPLSNNHYLVKCLGFGQCFRIMRTTCPKEYKLLKHKNTGLNWYMEFKCTEKVEI